MFDFKLDYIVKSLEEDISGPSDMKYVLRPLTQTRAYLKTSGRVLWIA